MLDAGDEVRNTAGGVGGELVDVADDGWKAERKKKAEAEENNTEQERDGYSAGDSAAAAEFEVDDCVEDGDEDDGEEAADIDEQQDFAQAPGEDKGEQDSEGEEECGCGRRRCGISRPEVGWKWPGSSPDAVMHSSVHLHGAGGEGESDSRWHGVYGEDTNGHGGERFLNSIRTERDGWKR